MNLKKALEKAKELRGEDPGRPQVHPIRAPKKVQGTDWKPPVYAESSRVELDAATLVDHHCVCISPDAPELEHYKVLRTKIQHLTRSRGWRTVMITSPREAEGKTLTAVNLALTFAKAYNQTVMLVDCDLRRQGIHKMLGYERELGLVDFLLGERDLKEFITWPAIDQMTVISGGRTALNGAELLGSVRMKALVQEVKARYDDRYVLFDTAPILSRRRCHGPGRARGLHRHGGGGRQNRHARCQKGARHAAPGKVSRLRAKPPGAPREEGVRWRERRRDSFRVKVISIVERI